MSRSKSRCAYHKKKNQNGEGCSNTQSTSPALPMPLKLLYSNKLKKQCVCGEGCSSNQITSPGKFLKSVLHSLVVSLITSPKSLLKNVLGGCVESSEILILNIPLSMPSLATLFTARVIGTLVGVAPTTMGMGEIRILPPKSLVSEIHDIVSVESQWKQVHSEVQ